MAALPGGDIRGPDLINRRAITVADATVRAEAVIASWVDPYHPVNRAWLVGGDAGDEQFVVARRTARCGDHSADGTYAALFEAGCPCVEADERCPSKKDLVGFYVKRHEDAAAALRDVPEELWQSASPAEGERRATFPTVGALVNFVVNCHHMAHLGQLSAWRRAMGFPSVLGTGPPSDRPARP